MSWTNAVAAKKALIDALNTNPAAALTNPDGSKVKITYAYRGNEDERELVHGGRVEGNQSYPVAGSGSVRFKRDERIVVKFHVVVRQPGWDQYEAEVRATEIGGVFEEMIAAVKGNLTGMNGQLISIGVTAVGLDSDVEDEHGIAVLDYDVDVFSRLS